MSEAVPILEDETGFDRLLAFTLPGRNARGRAVRLGPLLDEILSAHDYPPVIKALLAEALVLTSLVGGLLKDRGAQLTMQAQTESGPISLLVCDYREGELRGYAQFDGDALEGLGANPNLGSLFGKGFLAITFDLAATRERYQGIVQLEGNSLAQACEAYFAKSEQVPSLIRLGVSLHGDRAVGGGLLLQHLPEGEEGRERLHTRLDHPDWEHVAVLGGSTRHDELVDPGLSLDALVWRLFHEEDEIRVFKGQSLSRGCRCTIEHYREVLARFPEEDRVDMRDEKGNIVVNCEFCSREFAIAL